MPFLPHENFLIELGNWILSLKTREILCVVLTARLLDRSGTLLTIRGATVSNSLAATGSHQSELPHEKLCQHTTALLRCQRYGSQGTFPKIMDRSEDSDTHSSVYPNV